MKTNILRVSFVLLTSMLILFGSTSPILSQEPDTKLPPQVINFEHLTTEDGLSNPIVLAAIQDEQGFMWFSTVNGLNKFDGYNFTSYLVNPDDPNDPTTVGGEIVLNLLIDSEGLFWIGTYGGGLDRYDVENDRFIHYKHDPDDPSSISHNIVQFLHEDSQGNLWLATTGGGLNRYDREQDSFIHYRHDPDDPDSIASDKTFNVYQDSQGILWVTVAHGVDRFDQENNRFIHYTHDPEDPNSLSASLRWSITEDHLGNLWFSGVDGGGLNRYDRDKDQFVRYNYDPDDSNSISTDSIRTTFEDSKGILWIATIGGGVNVYDRENDRFIRYQHDPSNPNSIIHDNVVKVYEDRSGVLWFLTFGGGISKYDRKTERFRRIQHDPTDPNSLSDNDVSAIFQDSKGDFWIGTSDGLNKYDPVTGNFTRYKQEADNPNSLSSNFVMMISEDTSGFLWIATLGQGVNKYDPQTGKFIHYKNDPDDPNSLAENVCRGVFYDAGNNELWIGHQSSVSKYDIEKDEFTRYETTSFIEAIYKDRSGDLWLGGGAGFLRYDRAQDKLDLLLSDSSPAIGENGSGGLWIGTTNGLVEFDKETSEFVRYTIEDGLIDNSVVGILDDGADGLWISTARGLSHFNIQDETFRNYDVGVFNLGGTYYKSKSGELFFGGTHGVTRFFHDDIIDNPHKPPIVLTSFSKFNQPVKFDVPVSSLEQLDLTYQDRVFSFEFAALDYSDPARNQYKYKLEGFDQDWSLVGSDRRFATYTNLDGGDYVFRVIGSNNDGVWNDEGLALKIHIEPLFWETLWFRGGVLILLGGLVFGGFRWRIRAIENQRQRLERQVSERTRELFESNEQLAIAKEAAEKARRLAEVANQAKSEFLSNMSHELRTPLNGILGYAQILKREGDLNTRQLKGLNVIQQSGHHLLTLINDVLDLAKIEAGKTELYPMNVRLPSFLEDIASIILARAEQKDLPFIYAPQEPLPSGVQADETRLRQVLLNLLGNAVKFTDAGQVTFSVSELRRKEVGDLPAYSLLRFEITDTGIGMTSEQLDRIFQPFEQVGDVERRAGGTGLGLAISHKLVRAMEGELQVKSEPGKGSTFWFEIELPVVEMVSIELAPQADVIVGYRSAEEHSLKVLVVDDKPYNRSIIVDLLEPLGFAVTEAEDGQQGVAQAQATQPDLIVTDLVMPVMTGFEATRAIRQIPALKDVVIIAMSASVFKKDEQESMIAGCDAFVSKPVNVEQFLSLIKTHLNLEWVYETAREKEIHEIESLVPPPLEELKELLDLINRGNIRRIRERAVRIGDMDATYRPFADRLEQLARDYKEKEIYALIEQYMGVDQ